MKYEDSAIAYYYDQETKARIHPWNRFQNQYRRSSVTEHARIAAQRKTYIQFVEYGLPLTMLVLGLGVFLWRDRKRRYAAILLTLGVIGVTLFFSSRFFRQEERHIFIGISQWVPDGNSSYQENIQGFKDALAQAGYVEGEIVTYRTRTASADADTQQDIAKLFVEEGVDLIYSLTTPGTLILKENVQNTPIVFSIVTYPVEAGIIESLQRSNNNLVGTRNWVPVIDQLDVFLDVLPTTQSIGFMHRAGEPNSVIQLEEMREAARVHGVEIIDIAAPDIDGLLKTLATESQRVDALYAACDTLIQGEAEEQIITFAHQHRIPSFSCNISGPLNGDLLGVVADFYQIGLGAGEKAVLILDGATPTSLQTETITRPFVYVNKGTAELLGIPLPQNVVGKAKEIIE